MKNSWSYTLFYKINATIGQHPLFDKWMRFCSHDLIYIMTFIAFAWATTGLFDESPIALNNYIKLLMTAGGLGILVSWSIGFVWPHVRPIRENPKIKQLIDPFGTWKSFPSDHTIGSFTIAFITTFVGAPVIIWLPLVICAILVSISRVWVGVHYPRDVVGGFFVAAFFSLTAQWFLANLTQPVYSYLSQFFL